MDLVVRTAQAVRRRHGFEPGLAGKGGPGTSGNHDRWRRSATDGLPRHLLSPPVRANINNARHCDKSTGFWKKEMIGPACPRCGLLVPFICTQWKLGRVFGCRGCGTLLTVSKFRATAMAATMLTLFLLLRTFVPDPISQAGLFVAFLAIGAPLTYLFSKVEVAAASADIDGG